MNSTQSEPQRIPFNLERALAGDPVVRRDGVKVSEVLRFKGGNVVKSVVTLAENGGFYRHNEDGTRWESGLPDDRDLFMAPKTQTVWVNLYGSVDRIVAAYTTYPTEETARELRCDYLRTHDVSDNGKLFPYLKTISLEVPA